MRHNPLHSAEFRAKLEAKLAAAAVAPTAVGGASDAPGTAPGPNTKTKVRIILCEDETAMVKIEEVEVGAEELQQAAGTGEPMATGSSGPSEGEAATKLQARKRGQVARQDVAAKREAKAALEAEQAVSATKLQARKRGQSARKDAAAKREAAASRPLTAP